MNSIDWNQKYEAEQSRLNDALGRVTEGGIIEASQHIGVTSVPGLSGSSCVDIALAVWPFPLEDGPSSKLEALGYQIMDGYTGSPQQRFQHKSGAFQLILIAPGTDEWTDLVLASDYLRHNEKASEEILRRKGDASVDKPALFNELLPRVNQWWTGHYGFSTLHYVADELKDAPFEWYISSGWALDLFLGKVGRVHHDVDVIVPRRSQMDLQKHMTERGWKFVTPFEKRLEPWPPHMRLELPRHQAHAHRGDSSLIFADRRG
jgi:GrpB-like predicted nucleotidyltransferase (UPF0157 family)